MSAKLMGVDVGRGYATGILDRLSDLDSFYLILEGFIGEDLRIAESEGKVNLNLNIVELQTGEFFVILVWRDLRE